MLDSFGIGLKIVTAFRARPSINRFSVTVWRHCVAAALLRPMTHESESTCVPGPSPWPSAPQDELEHCKQRNRARTEPKPLPRPLRDSLFWSRLQHCSSSSSSSSSSSAAAAAAAGARAKAVASPTVASKKMPRPRGTAGGHGVVKTSGRLLVKRPKTSKTN